MERLGEVTAVRGEELEVTFCRPADCEKCNACHGGQKQVSITVRGTAQAGDRILVRMPEQTISRASLIVYALPIAGLLLGIALGEMLPLPEGLGGIAGGMVGLAIPAAGIQLTERRRKDDPAWQAQVVRVFPGNSTHQQEE